MTESKQMPPFGYFLIFRFSFILPLVFPSYFAFIFSLIFPFQQAFTTFQKRGNGQVTIGKDVSNPILWKDNFQYETFAQASPKAANIGNRW